VLTVPCTVPVVELTVDWTVLVVVFVAWLVV